MRKSRGFEWGFARAKYRCASSRSVTKTQRDTHIHVIYTRKLVIVRSSHRCSGTVSVTALICSSRNRTRHRIFAFVSLLFSNWKLKLMNKIHTHWLYMFFMFIHLAKETTLIDWTGNSITTVYAKYLAKMLRMVRLWNKKCSETGPKRRRSGPEQYQNLFRYYLYQKQCLANLVYHSNWFCQHMTKYLGPACS